MYDVDSVYTDETHCEFWATVHYRLPRLSHTTKKTTPVQGKQGHAMIQNDVEEPTETRDSQAAGELVHCKRVKITKAMLTAYEKQKERTIDLLLVCLEQPSSAVSKVVIRDEIKSHVLLFCFLHATFISLIVSVVYFFAWPSLASDTFCINDKDTDVCPTSEAGLVGATFFILPLLFVGPFAFMLAILESASDENDRHYSTIVPTPHGFSNTAIPALTTSPKNAAQSGDSVVSSLTSHTAALTEDVSMASTSTEQESDERSDVRM